MPEAEYVLRGVASDRLLEELEEWLFYSRPELLAELRQRAEQLWLPFRESVLPMNRQMSLYSYCLTQHIFMWLEDYPDLLPSFVTLFDVEPYNEVLKEVLV